MLNGFNFSKVVLLSTLIFTYSNTNNSQLLHYQGLLLYVGAGHPFKLTTTCLVPDRAIKENLKKGLKDSQG